MTRAPGERLPGAYWRLWAAAGISNLGDGVFVIALPLLASRLTDSPISVGLITAFFSIPWLLFALPVGVLIDRVDRRKVMVSADLFRGALVGGLALIAAFGDVQIWMLWVLAFGLGVGEVFFDNSSQTLLPAVVPDAQLDRANGYFFATEVASNTFLGMPLGSLLFGVVVWLPFGLDAASFVVAALLAASLRGSFRPTGAPTGDSADGPSTMRSQMRVGFQWLRGNRALRNLALGAGFVNFALAATQATFVLLLTDRLGFSERAFGPLVAVIGVGSLLAGAFGGRIIESVGRSAAMTTASLAMVASTLAIGAIPVAGWVIAMTTLHAMMLTIWSIVAVSLRQRIVPDHLFGRVNGIYRWVSTGATPVGAVAGSVVANVWGLRAPYFVAAGVLGIAAIVVARGMREAGIESAILSAGEKDMTPLGGVTIDDTPLSLDRDPFDDLL